MIEVTLRIDEFDYSSIIDEFLPEMLESLSASGDLNPLVKMACKSPEASSKIISGILAAMPNTSKEQLLVKLVNSHNAKITSILNRTAAENGIKLNVTDAKAISY